MSFFPLMFFQKWDPGRNFRLIKSLSQSEYWFSCGEEWKRRAIVTEGKNAADTWAVAQFKFIPFVLATQNLNTVLFSILMYMNQDNMRNPIVSKVLHCGKNELKYIKMHKALVFLHYCLERYDCFSIYKIESGPFKFFKFCMQTLQLLMQEGTLTSFFYTQWSIQYCMEENSSSVEVLGKKIKKIHRNLKSIIWEKEMKKGPTCLQLPHTAHLSFRPHWLEVSCAQKHYLDLVRSLM